MFFISQRPRRHAAADQFPDRRWSAWRGPADHAGGVARTQASRCIGPAARDLGFSPLGNLLLYPLEQRFPPWDPARGAPDGIIVLGGPIDADLSAAHRTPWSRNSPDRMITAAALAHRYPNARLVYTGRQRQFDIERRQGSRLCGGDLRKPRHRQVAADHGTALAQYAGKRGILQGAGQARKSGERWLLVTSAFHMPRSVGLFRKAGFAVEPYPVDWRVGGRAGSLQFHQCRGRRARANRYRRARMDRSRGLSGHRQDRRVASGAGPKRRRNRHNRARIDARGARVGPPVWEFTPCNSKRRRNSSISPAWWRISTACCG